jgi:uncharacterized repeat protein (TIGR01451 family)
MRRLPGIRRVSLFVTLLALLCAMPASAQVVRAFTPRFSTNDNGDITLIGNTMMTCSAGGSCATGQAGTGNRLDDGDFTMAYVDVDLDGTTFSSSSATLSLPPGATVVWAGLHWLGVSNSATRGTVKFAAPVGGYSSLTATTVDATGAIYHGYVDVTNTVRNNGSGTYWVANVQSSPGQTDVFAGWSLVVVYHLVSDPMRNLVVYDGFADINPGPRADINPGGFLTPLAGIVRTRIGVVAGDGDLGSKGDQFELNGASLTDVLNPANNPFNSTISRLGAHVTTKNPNYVNQLGFDVDLINADGMVPNGATSASMTLKSGGDGFYPAVVTFATDLYMPVITGNAFQKTVADLNGGAVQPGDVLEYTVYAQNRGGDGATAIVARDTLPANTTFVPGSITILTGANPGAKTDAAGDDQAEYAAGPRSVTVRLGTGANAGSGGSMVPGVATTFRFRVTVNAPSPTGTSVANQAWLSFNGAQFGTPFAGASDADTLTAGLQPASVTVQPPLLSGTVFEDVNYGGGAGRSRAASTGVVRPNVRAELYSSAGAYLGSTTTSAAGVYSFDGWGPGSYIVRIVSGTVTSSRTGVLATPLPVQTWRTTAAAGTATGEADRVGGEIPSLDDAAANTTSATLASLTTATATAQSVAPVTMATAGLSGIDFGFNFDTIVNAKDAGQGSLRQFLVHANALANTGLAQAGLTAGVESAIFMVSDGVVHPGLRAGLPNLLTAGVVRISAATLLPALTDPLTRIDGGTQTTNVGNTNPGTLGTGGTVGVDAVALAVVERPEVELRDAAGLTIGLDLQAADLTLARLAIQGFGNVAANDAHADVRAGATAARVLIDACVIGTPATAWADPGAGVRGIGDAVRVIGADDGIVRLSLVGFTEGHGVALTGAADRWQVTGCEVRGVAIGNPSRAGIAIEASGTETIQNSRLIACGGPGLDAKTTTGADVLLDLTVSDNGNGLGALPTTSGVRLGGSGSRVDRCVISTNAGAGIMVVATGATNWITHNSVFGNGTQNNQIGIDLQRAGDDDTRGSTPFVTLNDNGDVDAGANGLLNYPVLETAVLTGGTLTLTGWARPGSAIELFTAAPDPSGFGEGQTWLTTLTEGSGSDLDASTSAYAGTVNGISQGSDLTNRFRFVVPAPVGLAAGQRVTATATIASATSEFSGVLLVTATGVTVSGSAYRDLDHDATRDAGEAGTGAAIWIKLVSTGSPGSAWSVVSADPVTGAYTMPFVSAGTYTLVLDDNATATDVTPAYPAGFIGTEAAGGTRIMVVASVDVPNQNFGLWPGSHVDGTVFRDDGSGGAVANDGVRQGGEAGLSGVRVRLASTACAGGVCDSVLTGGAGAYTLWSPAAAVGIVASVREIGAVGWISTGGAAGTTGGSYARATDATTFTPASGSSYTGVDFGDVPPNQLAAPGALGAVAGGTVTYMHTFTAGSAGNVTFSTTQSPAPAIPGWNVELRRDLDCDGIVDPGEPLITAPVAVTAGQSLCLLLQHLVPAGAPPGAAEMVRLQGSMSYTNASPALATVVALNDRTLVMDDGNLQIVKQVDVVTARPGDFLTYTITYRNLGPDPLSAIVIRDATPSYTVFDGAFCDVLGAGLTGCSLTTQPPVGAGGPLAWQLQGALAPGGTGVVRFRVRVQ